MKVLKQTIYVEVIYGIDDFETISVQIKCYGKTRKIDKRVVEGVTYYERYLFDVKTETISWNKDDFNSTENKCISNHIQNNSKEIYQTFCEQLVSEIEKKS